MSTTTASDAAKAVVRRIPKRSKARETSMFSKNFLRTISSLTPPNPEPLPIRLASGSYAYMREAFPDFHAEIHWQLADGDCVMTYKTYHGTHEGPFLGIAPNHRKIHFETVDVMRVRNGKFTEHWGVANLLSLMQQIGGWTPPPSAEIAR